MHSVEPFFQWDSLYSAETDPFSPFYGVEHSEFYFSKTLYNYYIHPQWEEFGSTTLYLKVLFAEYDDFGGVILEMMGEWNDALHNDIMHLKREVVDHFVARGIQKFIVIGENVLNFHSSEEDYYQEWQEDVEEGWIVFVNFRNHVLQEMKQARLGNYVELLPEEIHWRRTQPMEFLHQVDSFINRRIN